jgi:hypothetical protein
MAACANTLGLHWEIDWIHQTQEEFDREGAVAQAIQLVPASARVTRDVPDGILFPATPLPVQAGVALRRRFQKGTMIARGKIPTRCGIYRQGVLQSNGTFKRVQRCVVLVPGKRSVRTCGLEAIPAVS